MGLLQRFKSDQKGTVAMVFGLAILPILGFVGAVIDYSRATAALGKMQSAVDVAALNIVKLPLTASQADIDKQARLAVEQVFGTEIDKLTKAGIKLSMPTASRVGKTIVVRGSGTSESTFMKLFGQDSTAFGARSEAVWTAKKIELALVLDNTGSMADGIAGGKTKMDALKTAATKLLADLKSAAKEQDTVKVSIVPFDTEIRLDPATYRSMPWFDWSRTGTVQAKWTGYVYDRYNGYATSDAAPATTIRDSLYPAPETTTSEMSGSLQTIRPLTSLYDQASYTALTNVVSGMQPRGYTNIAIGTIWGLATLTPSAPFTEAQPASNKDVKKYMVVLTDGDNTKNWVNGTRSSSVGQIDTKTLAACTATKNEGVEVFTIRLQSGNASLLQSCASSSGNYFDVQNATQLGDAFKKILDSISGTRITS